MEIKRPESKQPIPSHAKKVFSGKIFDVYQWEQELFDGTTTIFEKIKRLDTVCILPVTDTGKIIFSQQEQPGIQPFIGSIGGVVDRGEDPFTAAKRELLEETGMVADEWLLWDAVQLSEKVDWAVYTFIVKHCHYHQEPRLDAGERIQLIEVSFDEFITLTSKPNFRDFELSLKLYAELQSKNSLAVIKKMFQ